MASHGIQIVEVGPRDGLQDAAKLLAVEDKVRFIELLAQAGCPVIEATSFVHPKRVPQMADAEEVFAATAHLQDDGLRLLVLVPNLRGYDRACSVGVRNVALFTAASETFNTKNTNATIEESMERFLPILEKAQADGVWVRGYVSTAFGCPYEGPIDPKAVAEVADRLYQAGCAEIALGDTIGVGTPTRVRQVVSEVTRFVPVGNLALHMHNTRGRALANIVVGHEMGIRIFDSSAGGIGGCPFAPGAPGNVSTESVVERFEAEGVSTGIDLGFIRAAASHIDRALLGEHDED
ncbi:MAG: hydroxymethylglutaryl-CoA lyase [Myxococcales bacterium]|nr:hydroxymethylglutaryl-CoA lyase [Myxococcales bacterium]